MITAAPSAAASDTSRQRSIRLTGSTPVLGSSRTSRAGRCTHCHAEAELAAHPAGQLRGEPVRGPLRSAAASSSARVVASAAPRSPYTPPAKSRFWLTDKRGPASGGRRQVPEASLVGRVSFAGVQCDLAHQRPQQGGLAGAVPADDRDHGTGGDIAR